MNLYNSVVYQIFPRNYSIKGDFKSITNDLKRIKDLGVDIIYLMPIHEIGRLKRKGTFGSPYAIKDYFSISKDLGNLDDFLELVKETHLLGMKIILDMVFNHTSPDNVLLNDHKDYYFHRNGKLGNRVGDWTDIVDLDTHKAETQNYLIEVLKYWVKQGVDGFRFDVASMIPLSFFKKARDILGDDIIFIGESIDPGFSKYLKEKGDYYTEDNEMYPTFDSLYNYNYFRSLVGYFKGENKLEEIISSINNDHGNLRLLCLENHDNERIASIASHNTLAKWLDFFSFIKGQGFIYAGQEYGAKHKPELFEKDPIDLTNTDDKYLNLYKNFILMKHSQKKIIHQSIELINSHKVKVKVQYDEGMVEERIFEL